jgi:SMC domain protein
MEVSTVIYIIVAFLLGAVIAYILIKKGKNVETDNSRIVELANENEDLKAKLLSTETLSKEKDSAVKKLDEVKVKYESLLNEANDQCSKLDEQLKLALEGKVDESIAEQLIEVETLKKKVKDLEEELEENEDDLADLKKRIRTKDDGIAELQDQLGQERKGAAELRTEMLSVKQFLDDKIEELGKKTGSLDFIQQVLSAKELSTEDVKKLNADVTIFESFVKGQFTDLSTVLFNNGHLSWGDIEDQTGLECMKQFFHSKCDQWASTKRKSWLDGKTTIAFVGEFSAGKTSIVNRILSQDDPSIPRLPVSTKATTAIPTYIAGGQAVSYSFISGDAKRKTILEETFKKVSKDVLDQVKGVSSLIKYFVMTYKNPNLDGLSILDTPGFNSNDSEDRERTIEVINECDALFWVFDVNAGTINRSSISTIKEKLNKPLYVVINKVDTKAASEVQKVEDLIRQTLAEEGLKVEQFIRFSAKESLNIIMDPIKSINRDTERDDFVALVGEGIERIKSVLNEDVKKYNKNYHEVCREMDEIDSALIDCLKGLRSDCETAASIPRWVEHLFSKDCFEMSASECTLLVNLLEQIANEKVDALAQGFDSRSEKFAEVQEAWNNQSNAKKAWQDANKCYEQFKKISRNIA